jgi:hypothetical protein
MKFYVLSCDSVYAQDSCYEFQPLFLRLHGHFRKFPLATEYNFWWQDDRWSGKDLEGSSRGLIKAFSRHFPWMPKENHEHF